MSVVRFVALLIATLVVASACSAAADDTTATTTTVESTTTTLVTGVRTATGAGGAPRDPSLGQPGDATGSDEIARKNLPVGTCFSEFFVDEFDRRVRSVRSSSCTEPHDAETFELATYPGRGGLQYPGDDEVETYAARVCVDAFEAYVGLEYPLSRFRIGRLQPDEASWDDGDRLIRCSLYDNDLVPLTESARGSTQ